MQREKRYTHLYTSCHCGHCTSSTGRRAGRLAGWQATLISGHGPERSARPRLPLSFYFQVPLSAHPQSLLPIHNDTSARLHLNTHATSRGAPRRQQQRPQMHMNAKWAPMLTGTGHAHSGTCSRLLPLSLLWECRHLNRIASSAIAASTSNGSLNFRFSRSRHQSSFYLRVGVPRLQHHPSGPSAATLHTDNDKSVNSAPHAARRMGLCAKLCRRC